MPHDVLAMLQDDARSAESERQRNRETFTAAAELMDMIRDAGMDGRITYAENFATGETLGETYEARAKREGLQACNFNGRA